MNDTRYVCRRRKKKKTYDILMPSFYTMRKIKVERLKKAGGVLGMNNELILCHTFAILGRTYY